MPKNKISVVPVGAKACKPFILEVMVFSPEAGYKFRLLIERQCVTANDSIWKLVFDLEKKIENEFIQIVHVSFTAGTKNEAKGISSMVSEGVTFEAAKVITEEVHPATKALEGNPKPTKTEKENLRKSMSKTAKTQLVSVEL